MTARLSLLCAAAALIAGCAGRTADLSLGDEATATLKRPGDTLRFLLRNSPDREEICFLVERVGEKGSAGLNARLRRIGTKEELVLPTGPDIDLCGVIIGSEGDWELLLSLHGDFTTNPVRVWHFPPLQRQDDPRRVPCQSFVFIDLANPSPYVYFAPFLGTIRITYPTQLGNIVFEPRLNRDVLELAAGAELTVELSEWPCEPKKYVLVRHDRGSGPEPIIRVFDEDGAPLCGSAGQPMCLDSPGTQRIYRAPTQSYTVPIHKIVVECADTRLFRLGLFRS